MRTIGAIAFILASCAAAQAVPARADQYDAILKFADKATAITDAQVSQYHDAIDNLWRQDAVVPVQVWRNSQDTTGPDGHGNTIVTHAYLSGYFVMISLPRLVPALRDNAAVALVVDRDKCNAGVAGCVVRSTVSTAVLQDIRIAPVFMGSNYPWGGFQ